MAATVKMAALGNAHCTLVFKMAAPPTEADVVTCLQAMVAGGTLLKAGRSVCTHRPSVPRSVTAHSQGLTLLQLCA
jgi:hypothetical protein